MADNIQQANGKHKSLRRLGRGRVKMMSSTLTSDAASNLRTSKYEYIYKRKILITLSIQRHAMSPH